VNVSGDYSKGHSQSSMPYEHGSEDITLQSAHLRVAVIQQSR